MVVVGSFFAASFVADIFCFYLSSNQTVENLKFLRRKPMEEVMKTEETKLQLFRNPTTEEKISVQQKRILNNYTTTQNIFH